MGRRTRYRPGSYYMTDDRTGFVQRAEVMKREWNGLMVDRDVWESRQPQDFVRGRADDQTVPIPRPLPAASFSGPIAVSLTSSVGPQTAQIPVDGVVGFNLGDPVGLLQSDGTVWRSTVGAVDPVGLTVTLANATPLGAAAGAQLIDYAG